MYVGEICSRSWVTQKPCSVESCSQLSSINMPAAAASSCFGPLFGIGIIGIPNPNQMSDQCKGARCYRYI